MKFDYMGRENYSPLYDAEKGKSVSWATILYERLFQEIQAKDKRKSITEDGFIFGCPV